MQIKTYTAASMKDALAQIKAELGPQAVIVSTREIRENPYGLMGRPLIEVVAAVDYDDHTYRKAMGAGSQGSPRGHSPSSGGAAVDGERRLGEEIVELKEMVKRLMERSSLPQPNPLREKLLERGIRPDIVDLVMSKLDNTRSEDGVRDLLRRLVRVEAPPARKVRIFLGTTGVGKTTTIAKMAARAVLTDGMRVGLVTLDSYRIGAIDQSRIYARILNIPFFSATSPHEFRSALTQLESADLVLVDTVGRSPFRTEYIRQLAGFFEGIEACTFLLMPVATRDREMETITRTFSPLNVDRMIFTKADEAHVFGGVITHNMLHRIAISHITTGQRVP
ncbi:MAG TPA: flagellar biosynthesis protein FlhF, partial [Deltaproteobacteria bacterium]|nr:flagellar biosynthesis protein FlhF [Deltaproteobacteria bacterium]